MRAFGSQWAPTGVGTDGVLHTWGAVCAETTALHLFAALEAALEADAQMLGAVIDGPVMYETFRFEDAGVPREVPPGTEPGGRRPRRRPGARVRHCSP